MDCNDIYGISKSTLIRSMRPGKLEETCHDWSIPCSP